MKLFESKVNKFTRFYGIRDQEVLSQAKSPEKSSRQIKLENMISSIPMFAESSQKMRMFHMRQTGSEKKFFRPLLRPSLELAQLAGDSRGSLANLYNPGFQESVDLAAKQTSKRPSTLQLGRTQLNPMKPGDPETATGGLPAADSRLPETGNLSTGHQALLQHSAAAPRRSENQSLNRSSHLNTSDPDQRALFLTQLHSSPKWQQIRNKNGRYPHIC